MRKTKGHPFKVLMVTLLIMALVVPYGSSAAFGATEEAASVYQNGVVYTVEGSNWDKEPQQSVAIGKDGKILFVGSDEGVKAYIGDDTEVIDLEGKVMLPSFLDSHVHAPGTALVELFEIYLYESITKDQTLKDIKDYIAAHPEQNTYWGNGFNMAIGGTDASGKGPKKEWLDEICSDKPVILTSNDGHNMWLNSKAFEMNKITKDTVHPTGTVQKSASGELWGTLTDASSLITMEQNYTEAQYKQALELFQENMLAWGYTGCNVMPYDGVHLKAMTDMEKTGDWHMWANLATSFSPEDDFAADLKNCLDLREMSKDSKLVKVTTAKFFMDGVIEGMTGYLSEPYDKAAGLEPDFVSVPLWDAEKVKGYFDAVMKEGIQIHVHSIGDAATTQTVDAMEYAQKLNPTVDARNTITHLQVVKDTDKTRMAKLGIIGSTQPFWHLKEPEWFEFVDKVALGEERAWKEYPVKSLIDAGVTVTFSGDYPVSPINDPFWAMEASVTRNLNNADYYDVDDITNIDDPTWLLNPAERISVKQAIEAYTKNVAYQLFKEDELGSIKVGKYADLIVVDQDLFKISPIDIDKTQVLLTVFNGEIVYGSVEDIVFTDIEGHWAKDAIMAAYEQKLFGGLTDTTFGPNQTMTRGMLVTVLGKYSEVDTAKVGACRFTDAASGMYYTPYVEWAATAGIVSGIDATHFAPNSDLTREQMAQILYSYIKAAGFEASDTEVTYDPFKDESSISSWALEAVKAVRNMEFISGRPDGSFDPKGKVTRAEAASMLTKMTAAIAAVEEE